MLMTERIQIPFAAQDRSTSDDVQAASPRTETSAIDETQCFDNIVPPISGSASSTPHPTYKDSRQAKGKKTPRPDEDLLKLTKRYLKV